MSKYHMKKDQSGAAPCTASQQDCPNGDFGHYSTPYEVYVAYELAVEKGEVPGLATIQVAIRKETTEQAADLRRDIAAAATDGDYISAVQFNLHPMDGATQRQLLAEHDSDTERNIAVRQQVAAVTQQRAVIAHMVEHERDPAVLEQLIENDLLTHDQQDDVLEKLSDNHPALHRVLSRRLAHQRDRAYEVSQHTQPVSAAPSRQDASPNTRSQQGRPFNTTSRSPQTTTPPTRGPAVIAQEMIDNHKNFETMFLPVNRKLQTIRQQLQNAAAREDSPRQRQRYENAAAALSEQCVYGKANLYGGINGQPALERATMQFPRPHDRTTTKLIEKNVENTLQAQGKDVHVEYDHHADNGRYIIHFFSPEETEAVLSNRTIDIH